jgi:hypothetical protein
MLSRHGIAGLPGLFDLSGGHIDPGVFEHIGELTEEGIDACQAGGTGLRRSVGRYRWCYLLGTGGCFDQVCALLSGRQHAVDRLGKPRGILEVGRQGNGVFITVAIQLNPYRF